jgi:hypothetical protein
MQGFIILAQQYRMNAVTSNNSIPGTPEKYGDACFIRGCSSSPWDELGQHYYFGIVLPEWRRAANRYMAMFPCNKRQDCEQEGLRRLDFSGIVC